MVQELVDARRTGKKKKHEDEGEFQEEEMRKGKRKVFEEDPWPRMEEEEEQEEEEEEEEEEMELAHSRFKRMSHVHADNGTSSRPAQPRPASPHSPESRPAPPRKFRISFKKLFPQMVSADPTHEALSVSSWPQRRVRLKPIWLRREGEIVVLGCISRSEIREEDWDLYTSHMHMDIFEDRRRNRERDRHAARQNMLEQVQNLEERAGDLQPESARALYLLRKALERDE
jgi:hypothetical protein